MIIWKQNSPLPYCAEFKATMKSLGELVIPQAPSPSAKKVNRASSKRFSREVLLRKLADSRFAFEMWRRWRTESLSWLADVRFNEQSDRMSQRRIRHDNIGISSSFVESSSGGLGVV